MRRISRFTVARDLYVALFGITLDCAANGPRY